MHQYTATIDESEDLPLKYVKITAESLCQAMKIAVDIYGEESVVGVSA